MDKIRSLVAEFLEFKYQSHKLMRHNVFTATGQYYLDEINDTEFTKRIKEAAALNHSDCVSKLSEIATKSEIPLAPWLVANLPLHQALSVFRRLPLFADEVDELAIKYHWCDDTYQMHRTNAIKSGALLEREVNVK